jgi:DNA-binding winged helix-turn-helix (wHTH) protein
VRIAFDEFELDEANAYLLRGGRQVTLAPTPFALLCTLARQPEILMTKDALLDAIWGHQFVSESVVKTAISDLRAALGDDPREPRFIETVSRRGYRFIARTTPMPSPAAEHGSATAATNEATASALVSPRQASSFVGRSEEMNRLFRAWHQARNGSRAVVWIAGEPGIGKTTLIEQFVASQDGAACARGQCVEHYGSGEPYLPVLEALAELCRADPALPELLRSVAPTWLLQLPWLCTADERDALRRELAGVGPDRMLREMGEVLDRYTEQRPLLLVTEDLHWSDRATIQLIDSVARRRGRGRLMWLASFRLAEVVALDHPLNRLRHELRLHGLCEELVLDPFSETEVAAYVAQKSGSLAHHEAFVRALHERTDGVPLFVSAVIAEVMEAAQQTGDDTPIEGHLAGVAVPERLAAIIDHYIAKLGVEQRTLLSAAAVCGVEFRVETLAHALGRDVASTALDCEQLVREHIWLGAPRAHERDGAGEAPYAFRHALFREVLYERTPASARSQLHRQVGAALEREREAGAPIAAAELAMHHDRARAPMKALYWYAQAAESALLHFSPTACISLVDRAFELIARAPEGADRDELELALATLRGISAFQALGFGSEARSSFARAYALLPRAPGHLMRGRLLHGFGYLLSLCAEYAQALEVADYAESLSQGSGDSALMVAACIVRSEVHHVQGNSRMTVHWIERGLQLVDLLDAGAEEAFVTDPRVTLLALQSLELLRAGFIEQARSGAARARDRARALRQPMTRLAAAWNDALLEVRLGNAQRVGVVADAMRALVDEFSLGQGQPAWKGFRGWADACEGEPLKGYGLIREAYQECVGLGMRCGASELLGYAAEALWRAADHDAAQREVSQALQVAEEQHEGVYLPQLLLLEGAIARAREGGTSGTASVRRAVEAARMQQASWFELMALTELCEHHAATNADRQALDALLGQLPETAGTPVAARARRLLDRSGAT